MRSLVKQISSAMVHNRQAAAPVSLQVSWISQLVSVSLGTRAPLRFMPTGARTLSHTRPSPRRLFPVATLLPPMTPPGDVLARRAGGLRGGHHGGGRLAAGQAHAGGRGMYDMYDVQVHVQSTPGIVHVHQALFLAGLICSPGRRLGSLVESASGLGRYYRSRVLRFLTAQML